MKNSIIFKKELFSYVTSQHSRPEDKRDNKTGIRGCRKTKTKIPQESIMN